MNAEHLSPRRPSPPTEYHVELTADERNRKLTNDEHRNAWVWFLSHPSVEHTLNLRIDTTLKQWRASEMETNRPAFFPTVRYAKPEWVQEFVPAANAVCKVWKSRIVQIDDEHVPSVRAPVNVRPLNDAADFVTDYYLDDNETRRIATRVMNRLNNEIYGRAARRKNDAKRLTALICEHDRGTRRHLHCLFGVPDTLTTETFVDAFDRACQSEPFIYRIQNVETVENLAGSILYNTNQRKSVLGDPILYLHPQRSTAPTIKETTA